MLRPRLEKKLAQWAAGSFHVIKVEEKSVQPEHNAETELDIEHYGTASSTGVVHKANLYQDKPTDLLPER